MLKITNETSNKPHVTNPQGRDHVSSQHKDMIQKLLESSTTNAQAGDRPYLFTRQNPSIDRRRD
jgi:hypothetical protein